MCLNGGLRLTALGNHTHDSRLEYLASRGCWRAVAQRIHMISKIKELAVDLRRTNECILCGSLEHHPS